MPRYKCVVEYDGTRFCGWQRQEPGVASVQEAIETALFQITAETTCVMAAGRTDSGVHATGQVAHCDLEKALRPDRMRDALNFYLREQGAAILEFEEVSPDFHARFSAIKRAYQYIILNRRTPSPLLVGRACHVIQPLNVEAMQEAANCLLGHHDFSAFRSSECQAASPLKTLDKFILTQDGSHITAEIEARSFLHHQVRIMMGTLILVGRGKWNLKKVQDVLASKDRTQGGPTASPYGLYLTRVDYPN